MQDLIQRFNQLFPIVMGIMHSVNNEINFVVVHMCKVCVCRNSGGQPPKRERRLQTEDGRILNVNEPRYWLIHVHGWLGCSNAFTSIQVCKYVLYKCVKDISTHFFLVELWIFFINNVSNRENIREGQYDVYLAAFEIPAGPKLTTLLTDL